MPSYVEVDFVSVTKKNMIIQNPLWLPKNNGCDNTAPILPHSCAPVMASVEVSHWAVQRMQLLSGSPADLCRGLCSSKIWLFCKSNLVVTWMHLHDCRCFQQHLRMLLQSLRAHCLAPVRLGCISMYLEALVRSPRVSGRYACGFWTD
jgi:hypothetical protein